MVGAETILFENEFFKRLVLAPGFKKKSQLNGWIMRLRVLFAGLVISTSSVCLFAQVPILRSLLPDPGVIYTEGTPWAPSSYTEHEEFNCPKNLSKAVNFWVKVYTEYQSHQGILHDVDNLNVVYEKVDFEFIDKNSELTDHQKAKAREHLVEGRKKQLIQSLKKIAAGTPESEWSDAEKALSALWEKEGGRDAIKEAADAGRLRFQLGQSDRIKEAIFLSGRYLPMMERVFKEEGVPTQLTRLVFVESSFNIFAKSKVGASGLWQIMPSAARGRLRINRVVDLRNHPEEATKLAAKMLKFNYQMLGAWPLAVTGYNHGPYGVKRLVERNQTSDIGELIETGEGRRFGFASRNFFASFLAVLEVESKAGEFFPGIHRAAPLETEELKLSKRIYFRDLVKIFEGDRTRTQLFNPHFQTPVYQDKLPLDKKSLAMIPVGKKEEAEKLLSSMEDREPVLAQEAKRRSAGKIRGLASIKGKKDTTVYRVNKGDTLYQISRQFGVSIQSILSSNDLKGPKRIRPGQVLIINR